MENGQLPSSVTRPRLLLVDGHAYAYRAFYAIRNMRSPVGRPTNAIFGFVKMLAKMRAALTPTHLAVVWDGGLDAGRQAELPEYKAQRPEMPADLGSQIDEIVEYLLAEGLVSVCQDGVEADDLLATFAKRARQSGLETIIASSDKDFMQLVSPGLGLLNPNDKSESIWGAEQVVGKTGVRPEQIVDYLSLLGDAVDNIPGVPGVGPKTAATLLNRFGSVDAIYSRLDEVDSERLRGALATAAAEVRRNQSLVRLKDQLDSAQPIETLAVGLAQMRLLRDLYARWGFRSLLVAAEATLKGKSAEQAGLL
jgi:DNA polymerase-1